MKEIKLNGCSHLRGGIVETAKVDETKLEFRNGVAVAEAEVKAVMVPSWYPFSYKCEGLINENFQEVFGDTLLDSYERNLMFLPYNKKITRFGDNDFIVNMSCYEDDRWWEEYRHIRTVNGFPTLVNRLSCCNKKVNETLMIMGKNKKALYSVESGKMLTPYVESISESETYYDIFDVIASVSSLSFEKFKQLNDVLCFKINSAGRTVSKVLSSLEDGYLPYGNDFIVEELLEQRQADLTFRVDDFEETIKSFQSDDSDLKKAGYVKKI